MEGNTLRDLVETHRELARESSVYEDVRVDVEELAALLDVAEAARFRRRCASCRTCDTDPQLRDALDRLTELNVIALDPCR